MDGGDEGVGVIAKLEVVRRHFFLWHFFSPCRPVMFFILVVIFPSRDSR